MAIGVLIVMNVIIVFTWPENYGDKAVGSAQSFRNALSAIVSGERDTVPTSQKASGFQ